MKVDLTEREGDYIASALKYVVKRSGTFLPVPPMDAEAKAIVDKIVAAQEAAKAQEAIPDGSGDVIAVKTGWLAYGGEGVLWYVDESETTVKLPEYDGSDSQYLKFRVVEVKA